MEEKPKKRNTLISILEQIGEFPTSEEVVKLVGDFAKVSKEKHSFTDGEIKDIKEKMVQILELHNKSKDELHGKIEKNISDLSSATETKLRNEIDSLKRIVLEMDSKVRNDIANDRLDEDTVLEKSLERAKSEILPKILIGEDIRNTLESLNGDDRLDVSAVKGIQEYLNLLPKAEQTRVMATNRYLYEMLDVNASGITDGQVLAWDASLNTWLPSSGGGGGTVTDVSVVTANGVSGSVATSTTTPAITLTLGAITPSSVVASGTIKSATGLIVEETGAGTDIITIQAPASISASYTLTLPVDDGANGEVLSTNGSGVLSWITNGTGDVTGPASSTDNAVARFDSTTGKIIKNSAVTIADTTGDITGGKYNTVAISGASTPTLAVTGTSSISGSNTGDQIVAVWSVVTVDANLAVNTGTLANKGTLLTMTLPTTAAVATIIRIAGMNAGLWKIAQNASQYIKFGNQSSTTGVGGYISSVLTYDAVEMICIEANLGWVVVSSVGNITVA